MNSKEPIIIATRGSALALAQANMILGQCRSTFPDRSFELKIIKTTGDKLQTASLAKEGVNLPRGLFTKELEVALLNREADLAVHSLKDLPTELPTGLMLGAVGKRADVRDVLIYRDADPATGNPGGSRGRGYGRDLEVSALPAGAVVATSSTRRKAQLAVQNPGLKLPDIRGNVLTRMEKLARQTDMDATVLALAGITRLKYSVDEGGFLVGEGVPSGLRATILAPEVMLPCVGQGAIGIEIRQDDPELERICAGLNDEDTLSCVEAERAFLAGMGGGCQSPVAAYAEIVDGQLRIRALSFASGPVRRGLLEGPMSEAVKLGQQLASELKD